jgi:hypothetical protein
MTALLGGGTYGRVEVIERRVKRNARMAMERGGECHSRAG